jgi:hypothetical protein
MFDADYDDNRDYDADVHALGRVERRYRNVHAEQRWDLVPETHDG